MMNNKVSRGPITLFYIYLALALSTTDVSADDWPIFRGPTHDGISKETNWNPSRLADGPDILFRKDIGTGFSSVTVKDGKAYVTGNKDDKDQIYCFDADTGREIWVYSYPEPKDPKYYEGGPSSSVTIFDGKTYTLSKTGDVYCLDTTDGKLIWHKDLNTEYGYAPPTWGFAGSPFVIEDRVILNAGSTGIALNKETGELIWKSSSGTSGYSTPVPFRHNNQQALLLCAKEDVVALDPDNGTIFWRFPWKTKHDVLAADPIVKGNRIFISSGYNKGCCVIEIIDEEPRIVWRNREMRNHFNSSVLKDGFIYGFDEQTLKCIEFATGSEQWSEKGLGKGSLMLANNKLIVLSESGDLLIAPVSPELFEPVSRATILSGSRCWSMPVLAEGRVYARNAEGNFVCVDLSAADTTTAAVDAEADNNTDWCQWRGPERDGSTSETGLLKTWPAGGPPLLWHYEGLGAGYAAPSVCDGRIYVPGTIDKQGILHAFDMNGKLLWKSDYGPEWTKSFPGSRSTPTVYQGKVYLISGFGSVYCLDAETGQKLWSEDIKERFSGKSKGWGYAVSPQVYDDKVIFSPGGPETAIVALHKDTGRLIWKTKSTGESDAYCPPLFFTHAGKKFLVTLMEKSVWFVNADDGSLIYRDLFADYQENPKDINPVMPIYHKGGVFTTSGYDSGSAMYQLSADGTAITRKWAETTLDNHHGGVVLVDGYIYGSNWKGNNNGDWICLDWETGKVMYETPWQNKGSIIAAEQMLYCYEEKDGHFALVNATPDTFDIVSTFKITRGDEQHWAHPVIADQTLYVRHGDALMAFDISNE